MTSVLRFYSWHWLNNNPQQCKTTQKVTTQQAIAAPLQQVWCLPYIVKITEQVWHFSLSTGHNAVNQPLFTMFRVGQSELCPCQTQHDIDNRTSAAGMPTTWPSHDLLHDDDDYMTTSGVNIGQWRLAVKRIFGSLDNVQCMATFKQRTRQQFSSEWLTGREISPAVHLCTWCASHFATPGPELAGLINAYHIYSLWMCTTVYIVCPSVLIDSESSLANLFQPDKIL